MMRWIRALPLALIIMASFGILAVMASGLPFINPVTPLLPGEIPVNANRTGQNLPGISYGRNLPGQKVHGDFRSNTNSCASCHITHQGPTPSLTFQSSVYNTCVTCHDGSLPAAYNVFDGMLPSGAGGFAGIFDYRENPGTDVSYHLTTGALTHGDAPGARFTRREPGIEVPGNWEQLFTCISCHGPHSTYSGRHLNLNPNGSAPRYANIPLTQISAVPERYGLQPANQDLLPWLSSDREFHPDTALYVYTSGGVDITDQFMVNYVNGQLERFSGSDIPAKVSFSQAVIVSMDIENHYSPDLPEKVTHRSGVTRFCTSCHVAYYDEDQQQEFAWHDRFYHLIGMNAKGKVPDNALEAMALEKKDSNQYLVTCLTCHFAHGTDLSKLQRRGVNWRTSGQLVSLEGTYNPEDTANLRYFNPDNGDGFGGRFEACYLCHDDFLYYPEVKNTSPGNDEYGVDENTAIDVSFELLLDASVPVGGMIAVSDGVANVQGTVSLRPDGKTLRFAGDLEAGKDYTVTVSGVKSRIGGTLREPYNFTFHTYMGVETASPTGDNIAVNSDIIVWMTDPVNEATIDESTFWVSYYDGEAYVEIAGIRSVSGRRVKFTALEGLPPGKEVTVVLSADIRSTTGAPLKTYSWSFNTAPE